MLITCPPSMNGGLMALNKELVSNTDFGRVFSKLSPHIACHTTLVHLCVTHVTHVSLLCTCDA